MSGMIVDPHSLTPAEARQRYAAMINPEKFGAVGDGSTDDSDAIQDAIDEANSQNGGIVMLQADKHYRAGGLFLRSGALLTGFGGGVKWAGGPSTAIISPPSGYSGWIIDSPPGDEIRAAGLVGLNVVGNVSSGASPDVGGVRIQDGTWCTLDSCAISATSLGAANISGTANTVKNNGLQNIWHWRDPLVADEGVLTCEGTDFWIEGNQSNGAMPLTDVISTTLDDLHKIGNLLTLFTSWIMGGNGEFSELGWKVSLYESSAIGMRGDTNCGPGLYVVPSTAGGSIFTNTQVLANCLSPSAADFAQMYVNDKSQEFNGVLMGPDWRGGPSPGIAAYGIHDFTSYVGFGQQQIRQLANRYSNIRAMQGSYRLDEMLKSNSAPPISYKTPLAGNPAARPASRFSAGKTFYDTLSGRPTFSDGVNWKDAAGVIVGNLLPPKVAIANDGTIQWDPQASTSTIALSTAGTRFGRGNTFALTATSAGVTAGSARMIQKTAQATPVVAGQTYQVGAQATGPAAKTNSMGISVTWLTAGAAVISTVVALADTTPISAGDAVNPTTLMSAGLVAPPTAAFALITFTAKSTTLANADVFKVGGVSLTLGSVQTEPNET